MTKTLTLPMTIAAFDHRGSLAEILHTDPHTDKGKQTLSQFKVWCMELFSPMCSGVLVDMDFGEQSLQKKDPNTSLLLSLEAYDYSVHDPIALPLFNKNWNVGDIAKNNALVKLILFDHPNSPNSLKKQELVQRLYEQSKSAQTQFLLEPILHDIEGKKTFEDYLEMIRIYTPMCDVLKLEFPFFGETPDTNAAHDRCAQITEAATVPWVLLSRGCDYDVFRTGLITALTNGASGFAVGRALWKEIGSLPTDEERLTFLQTTARSHMSDLVALTHQHYTLRT